MADAGFTLDPRLAQTPGHGADLQVSLSLKQSRIILMMTGNNPKSDPPSWLDCARFLPIVESVSSSISGRRHMSLSRVESRPDEVEQGSQRRRDQASAGIIEKGTGKRLPPVRQHGFELAVLQAWMQPILKEMDDAAACHRHVDQQIRHDDAADQRPLRLNPHDLALALELPGAGQRAARETAPQTGMGEQIARICANRSVDLRTYSHEVQPEKSDVF